MPRPINPGPAPGVLAASGLGQGGGAGLAAGSDAAAGQVRVLIGQGAAGSGQLLLVFAADPPALWCAAAWAALLFDQDSPDQLFITWQARRRLVAGEILALDYQWSVSQ